MNRSHGLVVGVTLLLVAASVGAAPTTYAQGTTPSSAKDSATPSATGDFAGLIDIGGRRLHLECAGQGSPTVLLEAGYRKPRHGLDRRSGAAE